MDEKIQRVLSIIIFFSSLLLMILVAFNNTDNLLQVLIPASLLIVSFLVRHFLIHPTGRIIIGKILLVADIFLIFYINYFDTSNFSQIYFYLIVAEAVVYYFSKYGLIYTVVGYMMLLLTIYMKYTRWNYFDFMYLFPTMIEISFYFVFVIGMIYIAGYQISQSRILKKTMSELKEKSLLLEDTNKKLHETMKSIAEITALRERNRIAREIHDTIGHTLTTVTIEIEAGKRLTKKNMELAMEKLELAQEQARKGLNDIRTSVKLLRDGSDILSLIQSIQALVDETEKHTGVKIKCEISPLPLLTEGQEKVLYHALQEGLTNGIRHGKCSEFELKLEHINNSIIFTLYDNGRGCNSMALGFGLTVMKESVEELGGSFRTVSTQGQGYSLYIEIPV